ncbi:hypothetical protein E4T42_07803 [Aureobasidium subglaciale]|uniref:Rhodopsin domain-containing protein n=1 Tax=Aureobasidium subglaciale (strain EXF-2481) TaxID=1043005 RepID=A0A074YBF9_AURSE|nr:uncharacterized protein AUEXF2481DRAFT_338624 [Aureobasidium subglaciale EXF-2481]KAI5199839.1 hypothetical protein E4T38_06787 [Aureobasidium subglaciale]KAI5218765.1 hypothetical protein E4T40_06802 [Aureobasidium subglaciale]KAI5222371.1 hypothetical protein E4T41_06638 [Aureobasidium subglaciale]KAI5242083.1 hypothetical protein E4T42_07803 [Aureobasidium subglaciale]KAI5259847.1 hypothetical protein E4T46_06608 [Aureobasidium subglaciale]
MKLPPTDILVNWPIPNYEDPETQGLPLIVVDVIFMALISLAVPLRLYGRYTNKGRLGWDDFNMAIAYLLALALGIVVILANVRYQWDRHLWDVEFTMFQDASIVALLTKVFFTLAGSFARASLICFYFRLIKDTGYSLFKYILWAAFVYNLAIGIAFLILAIFLCSPVESYWVFPMMDNAKCLDEGPVTLVAGVLNCISDLTVTLLPIPIIMGLNMPFKQRLGVVSLLSMGLVVTVAGVVRTYYIWRTLMATYDETWDSMPLFICAIVEIDLAILCGCAPALKPLFAPMISHVSEMISTVTGSGSNSTRGTRLQDTTITRSTVISQHNRKKSNREEEGDKIPMHFVTVDGRVSDDSDESSDHYHATSMPASHSSTPSRGPRRSGSRASSQRTMLPHREGSTTSWDAEGGAENEDHVPEIQVLPRRHGAEPDVERGNYNTDWRVSKGVKAGWI